MDDPTRVWLSSRFESEALSNEPGLDLTFLSDDEVAALEPGDLQGVDAYVGYRPDLPAEAFEAVGDDLSLVVRPSAGFDNVDLRAATQHGVAVAHAPQGPRDAVVEGVIAMMISCIRGLHAHTVRIRERGFDDREVPSAFELGSSTVGIVGLGGIGRRLTEYLETFGPDLQAYDPYVDPDRAAALGVDLVSLDELLETSDVVSIHVPLTDETRHLLGEDDFRTMKETAFLLNAARGGVYPDEALAKAVREGWIAGAAVDVFEDEPDVGENPLVALDQEDALLTPHILGNASVDAQARVRDLVVDAVLAFARGEPPANLLNPEAFEGPVPADRISEAHVPE